MTVWRDWRSEVSFFAAGASRGAGYAHGRQAVTCFHDENRGNCTP